MINSIVYEGRKIHTEVEGEGESVLLVHADFVDGRMWEGIRTLLAPRFRVAGYDKLGYGRSDPFEGSLARHRELAAVVDALELGSVHLIGCSNGGTQALDFALEHPERVRSLTMINAGPSGWEPEGEPPAILLAMIEALQQGDRERASELQVQIWFDGPQRRAEELPASLRELRSLFGRMNRPFVDRGTFFAVTPELPDPPALKRLGEVKVPTLIVDGQNDWPVNRQANRWLATTIPGARLVEMAGAHVAPAEDPEEFVQLWTEFL